MQKFEEWTKRYYETQNVSGPSEKTAGLHKPSSPDKPAAGTGKQPSKQLRFGRRKRRALLIGATRGSRVAWLVVSVWAAETSVGSHPSDRSTG
jgi:hypothetical protein